MNDQRHILWSIAGACAILFAISVLAERRRSRRRDPDRVGWMPWTLVQLIATLGMVFAVALALGSRAG